MSLLQDCLILLDPNYMPTKALSTMNLDDSTLNNQLAKDSTSLPDLNMYKELSLAIYSISSKERLAITEASKFFLSSHIRNTS